MQRRDDGAALFMPALDERQQVLGRRPVDRAERFVQQDHVAILDDQSREERALQLAARQRAERPPFEA